MIDPMELGLARAFVTAALGSDTNDELHNRYLSPHMVTHLDAAMPCAPNVIGILQVLAGRSAQSDAAGTERLGMYLVKIGTAMVKAATMHRDGVNP